MTRYAELALYPIFTDKAWVMRISVNNAKAYQGVALKSHPTAAAAIDDPTSAVTATRAATTTR
jgi:hypothetical protein